ncbi:MAG: hypothetical protein ACYDCJ_03460 [Gammaproteobacteria bacterium]
MRTSNPERLWFEPVLGSGHSAFWPLPKAKSWFCQKKLVLKNPWNEMVGPELAVLPDVSANAAAENMNNAATKPKTKPVLTLFLLMATLPWQNRSWYFDRVGWSKPANAKVLLPTIPPCQAGAHTRYIHSKA